MRAVSLRPSHTRGRWVRVEGGHVGVASVHRGRVPVGGSPGVRCQASLSLKPAVASIQPAGRPRARSRR